MLHVIVAFVVLLAASPLAAQGGGLIPGGRSPFLGIDAPVEEMPPARTAARPQPPLPKPPPRRGMDNGADTPDPSLFREFQAYLQEKQRPASTEAPGETVRGDEPIDITIEPFKALAILRAIEASTAPYSHEALDRLTELRAAIDELELVQGAIAAMAREQARLGAVPGGRP